MLLFRNSLMLEVWMDLKGFDVWLWWLQLWVISNDVPQQESPWYCRLFNSTAISVVHKWPLTIENAIIKSNEMKLKCLKFCSLNIASFFRRSQIKVDLQLKRFSKITLGPAFPVLQAHYGNMSRFLGFLSFPLGSRFSNFSKVLLGSQFVESQGSVLGLLLFNIDRINLFY